MQVYGERFYWKSICQKIISYRWFSIVIVKQFSLEKINPKSLLYFKRLTNSADYIIIIIYDWRTRLTSKST